MFFALLHFCMNKIEYFNRILVVSLSLLLYVEKGNTNILYDCVNEMGVIDM